MSSAKTRFMVLFSLWDMPLPIWSENIQKSGLWVKAKLNDKQTRKKLLFPTHKNLEKGPTELLTSYSLYVSVSQPFLIDFKGNEGKNAR